MTGAQALRELVVALRVGVRPARDEPSERGAQLPGFTEGAARVAPVEAAIRIGLVPHRHDPTLLRHLEAGQVRSVPVTV